MSARGESGGVGVVIPVRAFVTGKTRLEAIFEPAERAEFLQDMADRVVGAAGSAPVAVVTSAPEVAKWAGTRSATVLPDPGSLDEAAALGLHWAADLGLARVVIAHADLPFASSLAPVMRDGSRPVVSAVPCHRDDGTPVLSVPVGVGFRFAYGPGSFRRHAAEARRCGVALRVVRDPGLSRDVDRPEDLVGLDLSYDLRCRFARVPVLG